MYAAVCTCTAHSKIGWPGDLRTDSLHVMEWLTCDPLGHGSRDNYVRVVRPIFSTTGVVIISLAIISKPWQCKVLPSA